MFARIIFWLKCSRYYTLPMTLFSWLIIFCYAIKNNGNWVYGIIALFGICCCHLATNLFDDFIDFKFLKKKFKGDKIILPNTQKGKCVYLLNGSTTQRTQLFVVFLYLILASSVGLFFFYLYGFKLLIFMAIGGGIVLSYPLLSSLRMSELAIGTAFGPLLFCGTNFVMTGNISLNSILVSIPSTIFTLNLIYTDTLMDYDIDTKEGKKTFIRLFSKTNAVLIQILLLTMGYFSLFKIVPIGVLTLPLAIDLLISDYKFAKDSSYLPKKHWYHFPFEEFEEIKQNRSVIYMFRMYQARNLMIYTSILMVVWILFYSI